MKKNLGTRICGIAAAFAGAAILLAIALHNTSNTQAAITQQVQSETLPMVSGLDNRGISHLNSAAYRDGMFEGELARERGESVHISAGRWSSERDRVAYRDGYAQGFSVHPDGQNSVRK